MKYFKYLFITLTSFVLIIVGVVGYTFAKGYIEQPVYPTDEYGSLDKQPIVSVMRQSDGGTTVKIINKTGSTLKYNGYEATHPLLRHEVRKGDKWIEENWDWCGTGISHYSNRCKVKLNSSGNVVASKSSCTVRGWEGKGNVNVTGGKIKVSSSCGVSGSISQGALGTVKIESGTLAKDKNTFSAVAYDAEFPAYITHLNAVKR